VPAIEPDPSWSPAKRLFVLLTLCVVAAVNLIDRQLITILLEPIKRDIHATDTTMGLLTGLSFALVYATAALPLARWSDRTVRRDLIALCLLVWGGMTMLCGLARSYWQLAAARMGVALGEAGYNPCAHSMIADLYPLSRRGGAIGLLNAAASFGIGFGLACGGWLSTQFSWRVVFAMAGVPCLALAFIIRMTVPEPPRGMSEPRGAPAEILSVRNTLAWLGRLRVFRYLAAAAMACAFVNYGLQIWAATFFIRIHGMSAREVGLKLGVASAVGLFAGTVGSGIIADRLGRRDVRWYMRVTGFGMLLTLPFGALTLLSSDANLAFAFYCVTIGMVSCWASPIHAMTQTIAAPRMRGMAAAIIGFCLNLVGYGLGPLFVGVLNDRLGVALGVESVRYSLLILLSGCVLAAWLSFAVNASVREDLQNRFSISIP
jgi:predicted MFS family arabinose efflux permease